MNATTIVRKKTVNPAGEQLGRIKDLMIDLDDAQVAYAVLSFGGWLGLGDKLFAIPPEALSFEATAQTVILDIDREALKEAPCSIKLIGPTMLTKRSSFPFAERGIIMVASASRMTTAS
jgi:hypothetical protein